MEQNTDEGRTSSRRATQGCEPEIKGHMKYLERCVLQIWS